MLQHLQKCFANVFHVFANVLKCFGVKYLQNILEVITFKIKQNFYFTCKVEQNIVEWQ